MTPKEKAESLVDRMYGFCFKPVFVKIDNYELRKVAIVHAMICVEEMLSITPMYTGNLNEKWKFYSDVLNELKIMQ